MRSGTPCPPVPILLESTHAAHAPCALSLMTSVSPFPDSRPARQRHKRELPDKSSILSALGIFPELRLVQGWAGFPVVSGNLVLGCSIGRYQSQLLAATTHVDISSIQTIDFVYKGAGREDEWIQSLGAPQPTSILRSSWWTSVLSCLEAPGVWRDRGSAL